MSGTKKSLYLSEDTVSAIGERYPANSINYSEAINSMVDRYAVAVDSILARLDITDAQWSTLVELHKTSGWNLRSRDGAISATCMLLAHIYPVADPVLRDKIENMTIEQRIAVIDMIERYSAE